VAIKTGMTTGSAQEVIVTVSPDGHKIDIDANGFKGGTCEDFMGPVMKALGEVKDRKEKPEFYEVAGQTVHIGG